MTRVPTIRQYFNDRPEMAGHAAMFGFSCLVAGSFALGGIVAPMMSPIALNAVRFIIALVVVGTAAWVTTGIPRSALQAPWRYLVLGGLFSIYFVSMFEGLKTATPVSTAAVFTLTPIMAGIFGWVLLRQVTTGRMALALTLAAIGALWIIFRADLAAFLAFDVGRGERIFFVGCIAHALYIPMVRMLNRGEPVVVLTFGMLIAGTIILVLWGARDLMATDWAALPLVVWITILYLAIFASSVTFFMVQFAAMRLKSAKVMAYTYLVPAWVILWEGALGHGWPAPLILVGMGLVVTGLLLLLKE